MKWLFFVSCWHIQRSDIEFQWNGNENRFFFFFHIFPIFNVQWFCAIVFHFLWNNRKCTNNGNLLLVQFQIVWRNVVVVGHFRWKLNAHLWMDFEYTCNKHLNSSFITYLVLLPFLAFVVFWAFTIATVYSLQSIKVDFYSLAIQSTP